MKTKEKYCLLYKDSLFKTCESEEEAIKALNMICDSFAVDKDDLTIEHVEKNEIDILINSYSRWGMTSKEKEDWNKDLIDLIKEEYDIIPCPRCGEDACLNICVEEYPVGIGIILVIYCPECRKIEVRKTINSFYGGDGTVEKCVNEFNSLKEKF